MHGGAVPIFSAWIPSKEDIESRLKYESSHDDVTRSVDINGEGAGDHRRFESRAGGAGDRLHIPELEASCAVVGVCGSHITSIDVLSEEPPVATTSWSSAIAVGVHNSEPPCHAHGTVVSGPGYIQVWKYSSGDEARSADGLRCACLIEHDGSVAQCVRWCPASSAQAPDADTLPRLGLLAAVLGNGTVAIYSVPEDVPKRADGTSDFPPTLALRPVAAITLDALGGQCPTVAAWHPEYPHARLLVGTVFGYVAVARLAAEQNTATAAPALELLVKVFDVSTVRCVAWAPPHAYPDGPAEDSRHLFCAGGGAGALALLDARDPLHPVADLSSRGDVPNSVLWLRGDGRPLLAAALQNGHIKRIALHSDGPGNVLVSLVASPVTGVLSLAYSDQLKLVAYGSGRGAAGALAAVSRMNPSPAAAASLALSRYVPHAVPLQARCDAAGRTELTLGSAVTGVAALIETGVRMHRDAESAHSDLSAHPWAAVTSVAFGDHASMRRAHMVCGTGGGLLYAVTLAHRQSASS